MWQDRFQQWPAPEVLAREIAANLEAGLVGLPGLKITGLEEKSGCNLAWFLVALKVCNMAVKGLAGEHILAWACRRLAGNSAGTRDFKDTP